MTAPCGACEKTLAIVEQPDGGLSTEPCSSCQPAVEAEKAAQVVTRVIGTPPVITSPADTPSADPEVQK